MTQIYKNGIVKTCNLIEGASGGDALNKTYFSSSPYVLSGKVADIWKKTDMYAEVVPGKTYYYTCKTDKAWAANHGASSGATIWLYLSNTYSADNQDESKPINFNGTNMIANGVWKYTMPSDCHMARVRLNTYSNGTTSVTTKFWDIHLIPEDKFVQNGVTEFSFRIGDTIVLNDFIEI